MLTSLLTCWALVALAFFASLAVVAARPLPPVESRESDPEGT